MLSIRRSFGKYITPPCCYPKASSNPHHPILQSIFGTCLKFGSPSHGIFHSAQYDSQKEQKVGWDSSHISEDWSFFVLYGSFDICNEVDIRKKSISAMSWINTSFFWDLATIFGCTSGGKCGENRNNKNWNDNDLKRAGDKISYFNHRKSRCTQKRRNRHGKEEERRAALGPFDDGKVHRSISVFYGTKARKLFLQGAISCLCDIPLFSTTYHRRIFFVKVVLLHQEHACLGYLESQTCIMNILDILSNPLSEKILPGFLKGLEKSFFSTNNKKDYPSQPLKWNMYGYLQKQKSANVSVETHPN